jgi:hypothetical protein
VVSNSQADLQDCLIGDNGKCQVLIDTYSDCNLAGCEVLGNTAPAYEVREHAHLLIDGKPASPDDKKSATK